MVRHLKHRIFVYRLLTWLDTQVPKEWKLDPDWDGEQKPQQLSHLRRFPSKWSAATPHQDPINTVKIIDQFVIRQTEKPDFTASNGSVSC